jgi:hypothetical protein
MAGDLSGCRAKVKRAERQLTALNRLVVAHCSAPAKRNAKPIEFHPEANVFALRFDRRPPPIRWGVLAGEIVHNLRSALDHLVWQMVLANGGQPQEGALGHSFPIWLDGPKPGTTFAASVTKPRVGKLRGVHPDHVALIEQLQPYMRLRLPGESVSAQPFAVLDDMWNRDKHRLLHGMRMTPHPVPDVDTGEITLNKDAGHIVAFEFIWDKPLKKHAVFGWVKVTASGNDPQINTDLNIPCQVTVEQTGRDLMAEMNRADGAVSGLIEVAATVPPF